MYKDITGKEISQILQEAKLIIETDDWNAPDHMSDITNVMASTQENPLIHKATAIAIYRHHKYDERMKHATDMILSRNKNSHHIANYTFCLLYTSPSPRDRQKSRMPSSA